MAKLTKAQLKLHNEAVGMMSTGARYLPVDDIEFILENWRPDAVSVTGSAAFFTPYEIAVEFAAFAAPSGGVRVVDFGAGIGALSHAISRHSASGDIREITCIEYYSPFLEIGKRLFPDFIWEFGNMFDEKRTNTWDVGISNPPYGIKAVGSDWMRTSGASEIKAIELIITKCKLGGTMILPEGISCYDLFQHRWRETRATRQIDANYPGWKIVPLAQYEGGIFRDTQIAVEFVDVSRDDG